MKAISLIEPAANTCASLLTMRLRTTWAHVQLAVLHLCTESLQRMCFINQIISEKAIFNFTGYKWHASVLYTLHWMLNAGTKWYSWYQGEIFHYDEIQSNLQMNSRFLASLSFPFLCGTWKPEKQLWLTLDWGHCHCQCSTILFILWSSRRDSHAHSRAALDTVFCIHFSNGLFSSPPFTEKQGYGYQLYLQLW